MKRPKQPCAGCGKMYLPRAGRPTARFCSKGCMATDMVFLSLIEKGAKCWMWTGSVHHNGYGKWKRFEAHRYSYELHKGPIPDGLLIMHSCDNPLCVNPDHLMPGTIADNIADCVQKGRNARGERMGSAKLTDASVAEIRQLYATGSYSARALGPVFGVSKTVILQVANGTLWRHVPGLDLEAAGLVGCLCRLDDEPQRCMAHGFRHPVLDGLKSRFDQVLDLEVCKKGREFIWREDLGGAFCVIGSSTHHVDEARGSFVRVDGGRLGLGLHCHDPDHGRAA